MITKSVASVVVTYNRKELLCCCLDAISAQTRPVDRIIIVDNCSTDGTQEFLREKGHLGNTVIDYVRLTENMGSAGGWHTGMRRAYEHGYDWIWTVDDDGAPLPDNLLALLNSPPRFLFRGSLVVSSQDPERNRLAVGVRGPSGFLYSVNELEEVGAVDGMIEGYANPWNGVLISREVVRRIGVPKKELFNRCVETEYFLRATKAGITIGTNLAAKVLHRPGRQQGRKIGVGPLTLTWGYYDDPFYFYLYVRNLAYTLLRHRGPLHGSFLKHLAYPVVYPRRAALSTRALCDGVAGRFLPPEQVRAAASRLFW